MGVLGVYRNSLTHVQLSGPTLFAPVIGQVRVCAQFDIARPPTDFLFPFQTMVGIMLHNIWKRQAHAVVLMPDQKLQWLEKLDGTAF